MPSDLCVAFHGGGTLLQVHALDDGIFPELLFNGQHGLLAAALPLQLLFLGGGLLLGAFAGAGVWQTLENGLGIIGAPVGIQRIVIGVIVAGAVLVDVVFRQGTKKAKK